MTAGSRVPSLHRDILTVPSGGVSMLQPSHVSMFTPPWRRIQLALPFKSTLLASLCSYLLSATGKCGHMVHLYLKSVGQ